MNSDWGELVDPVGDCRVRRNAGVLTITVPPTTHDLSAELDPLQFTQVT